MMLKSFFTALNTILYINPSETYSRLLKIKNSFALTEQFLKIVINWFAFPLVLSTCVSYSDIFQKAKQLRPMKNKRS